MEDLLNAVTRLRAQYGLFGLRVPFNDWLLLEMLTEGLGPTAARLEIMINSDFRGCENFDNRIAALRNIKSYLEPLERELATIKTMINQQKTDMVTISSVV